MKNGPVWVLMLVLGAGGCSSGGEADDGPGGAGSGAPGGVIAGSSALPGQGMAGAGSVPVMNGSSGSGSMLPVTPGVMMPVAGGPGMQPMQPDPMKPGEPTPVEPTPTGNYDYEMEQVSLDADLVIKSGETLRVGPGVTFTATKAEIKVQIDGTLIAEGSAMAPVRFVGAGTSTPRSWHGVVVGSGGNAQLSHVEIGGATYGLHALPGSKFTVDYGNLGTSFKAAVIESDGSFDHTRFHASGDPTFSPVNEVSIDDVNGTLTILAASPKVTNSIFDGSAALVDMVRIGGSSSPTFDHVKISDAHCAFHTNGGTNTSPRITNSVMERLAYGIMAYATKPIIENSVFRENGYDVGFCFDAVEANAAMLSNNFYAAGSANIDPSCFQIGVDEAKPAATANSAAGPVGL